MSNRLDSLSPLQLSVFEEAKLRLSKFPWFAGVCLDEFPSDEEIEHSFEDAVISVMMETAFWDDPDFYSSFF